MKRTITNFSPYEFGASESPPGLEQHRLDRLLELRATIDSLRTERGQELLLDAKAELARDYYRP
jgi:hypothetical protein